MQLTTESEDVCVDSQASELQMHCSNSGDIAFFAPVVTFWLPAVLRGQKPMHYLN